MDEQVDELNHQMNSRLMKSKKDHFKTKNEMLMFRAAKNNNSPGRDFHFQDKLELKDLKNRAKLNKGVFQSRKEFRSLFNEFMAPRNHESNASLMRADYKNMVNLG